jgi:hypothetical protein
MGHHALENEENNAFKRLESIEFELSKDDEDELEL